MSNSSGRAVKGMAVVIVIVMVIGSLVGAGFLWGTDNERLIGLGFFVFLWGIAATAGIGILLYAFGELVENSALMVGYMKTMSMQSTYNSFQSSTDNAHFPTTQDPVPNPVQSDFPEYKLCPFCRTKNPTTLSNCSKCGRYFNH